ncbi:hypothetical protein LIT25_27030 (plasmid) [Bacillus sp. F19]|nr:hypothetical protein LIT25_27030 [Bacillus sp. F19]
MYKKAVSTPEFYTIILRDYDEVYLFQTKEYNDDVLSILKWYIGKRFDVSAVFKNAIPVEMKESLFQSKKKLQEELEWKKHSYWFDEEGEELEDKIRQLMEVIYEEEA